MNKIHNTKKLGMARTIIFPRGKKFLAVCLDFDIIEEAKTRQEVETNIKEAITGYIENICKNNLSDNLLNRHADKKYWDMYREHLNLLAEKENFKKAPNNIKKTSSFAWPISLNAMCAI